MGDWRNMKEAVLIGAGQTGRGFIAPILQTNAYHITFIDKNKELIDRLNAEKSYTVHYFGDGKEPVTVTGYDAYTTADEEVIFDYDKCIRRQYKEAGRATECCG